MIRMAAAILALVLVQDEMADNPEYQGWSGHKAGAWVKFRMETATGDLKTPGESTTTLKELTPEKAVTESRTTFEVMGQKNESTSSRTIPARTKKDTETEGGKVEILGEGDEEIEIKGRKVKCRWVRKKITNKRGEFIIKNWRTAEIVGGSAKLEISAEKPMKMVSTLTAVDWKEGT